MNYIEILPELINILPNSLGNKCTGMNYLVQLLFDRSDGELLIVNLLQILATALLNIKKPINENDIYAVFRKAINEPLVTQIPLSKISNVIIRLLLCVFDEIYDTPECKSFKTTIVQSLIYLFLNGFYINVEHGFKTTEDMATDNVQFLSALIETIRTDSQDKLKEIQLKEIILKVLLNDKTCEVLKNDKISFGEKIKPVYVELGNYSSIPGWFDDYRNAMANPYVGLIIPKYFMVKTMVKTMLGTLLTEQVKNITGFFSRNKPVIEGGKKNKTRKYKQKNKYKNRHYVNTS